MDQKSPRRIVVADDNEDSAESFAMLLSFSGHEVRIAHDGAAALDAVRNFRPDVAFLDIGMPGLTGYDVAQRIKELNFPKRPFVIAITGFDQPVNRVAAEQTGFDLYMVKPVEPEKLLWTLRHLPGSAAENS